MNPILLGFITTILLWLLVMFIWFKLIEPRRFKKQVKKESEKNAKINKEAKLPDKFREAGITPTKDTRSTRTDTASSGEATRPTNEGLGGNREVEQHRILPLSSSGNVIKHKPKLRWDWKTIKSNR